MTIFGLFDRHGHTLEPALLAGMARALSSDERRGDGLCTDGPVGLGIAGPGRADDMRVSDHGDLVVVSDGHVDDRRGLARALGIGDDEAQAMSASLAIRHAFERWGQRCLEHLIGDFTCLVWNRRDGRLTAAAGAPLSQPLYYHCTGRYVALAGLARGLFALPGIERRIDEQRMAWFLTGADTGRRRTFFTGVRRLRPGEMASVDAGGVRITRWWSPDLSRRLALAGDDDYVEALDELLGRVIDDHTRPDRRTAISLSGGLDSGTVAAVAAPLLERAGRRLCAYTEAPGLGFAEDVGPRHYADETPYVSALATTYPNLDLAVLRDCRCGLLDGAERGFAASETPMRNPTNRGWIEAIYQRAREDGVDRMLNGDQGNLTVSWTGQGLVPDLLKHRQFTAAWRELRRIGRAEGRPAWRLAVSHGVLPLLPPAVGSAVDSRRGRLGPRPANPYAAYSLISPSFADEINLAQRDVRAHERTRRRLQGDGRARRLGILVETGIGAAEIGAGFRRTFDITTRVPLADRRLVEFSLQVPEAQYARDGQSRWLIRRAMAGRMPSQTLAATRRGVQAPYWFQQMTEEREELLDAVGRFEADPLVARLLDLPRLRRLIERWPERAPMEPPGVYVYRLALGRAMVAGAFLLWAQSDAAWH